MSKENGVRQIGVKWLRQKVVKRLVAKVVPAIKGPGKDSAGGKKIGKGKKTRKAERTRELATVIRDPGRGRNRGAKENRGNRKNGEISTSYKRSEGGGKNKRASISGSFVIVLV